MWNEACAVPNRLCSSKQDCVATPVLCSAHSCSLRTMSPLVAQSGHITLCAKPRVRAEAGSRVVLGERSTMASLEDWRLPAALPPKPDDYAYDLDRALSSVVGLTTQVPADAFTAEILGTERAGNGVLIRDNDLVLTIGYLMVTPSTARPFTSAMRTVGRELVPNASKIAILVNPNNPTYR